MPVLPQKPNQVRKDPVGRPVDGVTTTSTHILNRDPRFHYVLVYKLGQDAGSIEHYEDLGYEPVRQVKGAEQLRGARAISDGDVIESRGHILMRCPIETLKARYEQEQALYDIKERAIVKNRGGVDPLRGINSKVLREGSLQIENETEEARQVTLGG